MGGLVDALAAFFQQHALLIAVFLVVFGRRLFWNLGGGSAGDAAGPGGRVKAVHNRQEWSELLEASKASGRLLVADFTASWCPPCKRIAPHFAALSVEFALEYFVKVDVDKCRDVAQQQGIRAMPTFQFFKAGSKVDELQGADLAQLKAMLAKHGAEPTPAEEPADGAKQD